MERRSPPARRPNVGAGYPHERVGRTFEEVLAGPSSMPHFGGGGTHGLASQIRTVPSAPAEARMSPSGLNATPRTARAWPLKVSTSSPLATSQSLTVPSMLAEA